MKKQLIFMFTAVLLTSGLKAQKKEKVYSIVKTHHSIEWYQEQLSLWEKEVKDTPKNAEAWLNVYTAARMIKISGGTKTQKDLDAIVEQVKKNIPDTFEGNYIQYYNGNNDQSLFNLLWKAYEMDPERPETYDDLFTHYELKGDKIKAKQMAEKWFASNSISPGLYNYNYNVLMSCEKNAILITNGDNDTYPPLILQYAKNIRTDVKVINVYLLFKDDYRNTCMKELGVPEYKLSETVADVKEMWKEVSAHIRKYAKRPLYYANTVDPQLYTEEADSLYSVGLAYKYSDESFDNIAVIRKNVENNFLMDDLKQVFSNDISQTVVNHAQSNYLVPFLLLYKHYVLAEEKMKADDLKNLILTIAENNDQLADVKKVMEETK